MELQQPAVVLVRPQEEGNVGAAARAMANTGLTELILVEPAVEIGSVARAFAVGAGGILDRALLSGSLREALASFRRVVGATSARGRELSAALVTPRELPERLAGDPPGTTTALVFGPEASGLTNDELALCSLLVRIPCSSWQPTLNLAQAVLILAYELYTFREASLGKSAGGELPATHREIEGLFDQLAPLLQEIGFARDDTFSGVLRDLRRLASRGGPTSREVQILRGICRRAQRALQRQSSAVPAGARSRRR
ncbi:MAG: RNA methyltransferase [Thermoanaerobaculia bacterium]